MRSLLATTLPARALPACGGGYPVLARAVVDAGYEILSGDNEGFEAEISFVGGRDTNGIFTLREGPCGDQVTIELLYGAERYRRTS